MKLYTLKDMAEYFKVSKQYINKLKNNDPNFPIPNDKKGRVHLFDEEQVKAYEKVRDFRKPHANRVESMKRRGIEPMQPLESEAAEENHDSN